MDIKSHLKAGRVLNQRYRIDRLLATGGFGEVYEAFDLRMDRKIAVKYVFRRLHMEQLRNEVIILARHAEKLKFIPNVYDHWAGGAHDTGYYIVMEFVEGETLDKSRHVPWPSDEVITFLRILLSYLRDLHSLRIIHCDIKPVNIKLTPPNDWSYHVPYRLLDFGIAKQGDETTVPATTPHYAAPEQYHLSGLNLKIDHRTDLYGLAATAYFLLTGKPPIEAKIRYSNVFDLGHPDPLRAPATLVDGVPWALEATLLDMLQLDREQRPGSAEAALQILDRRLSAGAEGAAAEHAASATEIATKSTLAEPPSELSRLLVTELPAKADQPIVGSLPTIAPDIAPGDREPPAALPTIESTVAPSAIELALPSAPIELSIAPAGPAPAEPIPISNAALPSERPPALVAAPPAVDAPAVGTSKTAVLLDTQGNGLITGMIWSLDGQTILIGTTLGVYRYDLQTTSCELWQATDTPIEHVGSTCAGNKLVLTTGDGVHMLDLAGEPAPVALSAPTQVLPGQVLTAMQGRSVAVVTDDTCYVFNPDTDTQQAAWRLSHRLTGRKSALSADGQTVVIADADQLWCGSLRTDLRGRHWAVGGLPQPLADLALAPDGTLVAVASPAAIAIWRRGDKAAQAVAYTGEPIVKIALSSDGKTLAVATGTRVFLRSVDDAGEPKQLADDQMLGVQLLAFSPDDRMLAAASLGELRLWRMRDGGVEQRISQFGQPVQSLAALPGGRDLAVLGDTLLLSSIERDRLLSRPLLGGSFAHPVSLAADARGEQIAVATADTIQVWSLNDQRALHQIAAQSAQTHCLGYAADSGRLLLVARDSIEVYDPATGALLTRVALNDPHSVDHVALAIDGSRLAIHAGGRVLVRGLPHGEPVCTLQSKAGHEITALGLSGDGALLAVAYETEITLWRIDGDTLSPLANAALPEGPPAHHLALTYDGTVLASLHGAAAHIWRVAEGRLDHAGAARGHTDRVTDARLMQEGTRLVTTSRDGTLRLWQVPD